MGCEPVAIGRAQTPEVPVILVTNANNSAAITEALQAGAIDFIQKGRLAKLVPSIRRVIQHAETQRDLEKVRQELLHHAELLDLANDAIVISDAKGKNFILEPWSRADVRVAAGRSHGMQCPRAFANRAAGRVGRRDAVVAGQKTLGGGDSADPPRRRGDRSFNRLDPER
jgi:chemotaxis response regulator CheB